MAFISLQLSPVPTLIHLSLPSFGSLNMPILFLPYHLHLTSVFLGHSSLSLPKAFPSWSDLCHSELGLHVAFSQRTGSLDLLIENNYPLTHYISPLVLCIVLITTWHFSSSCIASLPACKQNIRFKRAGTLSNLLLCSQKSKMCNKYF